MLGSSSSNTQRPFPIARGAAVLFVLLVASRLVFLVPAFHSLVLGTGGVDLEARRAELNWAMHGLDPELARLRVLVDRAEARGETIDRGAALRAVEAGLLPPSDAVEVGAFADGDLSRLRPNLAAYPSWSYPMLAPLIWPPWPATKAYYAAMLALSLLGLWWLVVRDFDRSARPLTLLLLLIPMSAYAASVNTGQVTVPVILVLCLFGWFLQRGNFVRAGLMLGLAAIKPTLSLPFAFALAWPVLRGRASLRSVAVAVCAAGALIAVASGLMWLRVGVDPLTALSHVAAGNQGTAGLGYGLLPAVVGFAPEAAWMSTAFAAVGLAGACCGSWVLRSHSLLCQFAFFGLLARLWAYHRHYDDLLLLFLILALWVETRRGSQLCLGALVVVALTLATPSPTSTNLELWRVGSWVLAGIVLLYEARPRPNSERDPMATDQHGFLSSAADRNDAFTEVAT